MNATVTGKFSAVKQAARAVDKLLESCVSDDRVRTTLLKSSAQRPVHAAANTGEKSSRSRSHEVAAPSAGGGLLDNIGDDERRSANRPAGILVAVETPDRVSRALAVSVLRQHGARIIEIDTGAWPDARPVSLSALFDKAEAEKKQSPSFVPIEIERPSSPTGALRTRSEVREHSGRQPVTTSSSRHKDSFGKP
jgi:hypothetical protein